jgi:hypothetical protein
MTELSDSDKKLLDDVKNCGSMHLSNHKEYLPLAAQLAKGNFRSTADSGCGWSNFPLNQRFNEKDPSLSF